tara:strand:- start:467 stop:931 length:465 start_codon:yes stop_codon:yes gene_type:complete
MIKVNVLVANISWKKYIKNPHKYLKAKIKKIDLSNKIFRKKRVSFSILLAGNKHIKNLNNKFRNKNKLTDILSFPFYNKKILNQILKKKKEIYLGDIIININKITKGSCNKDFLLNFDKIWIHGFFHLLGHRHKTNADYFLMNKLEKKFLKIIN